MSNKAYAMPRITTIATLRTTAQAAGRASMAQGPDALAFVARGDVMLRMLSVCSGIGGMDLGAMLTQAIETVAFSEIEPFPCAVLAHQFPDIPNVGSIYDITKKQLEAAGLLPIDILGGGIPCQGNSSAGKRRGRKDPRNLWPEMARLVRTIEPAYMVVENVRGLLSVDIELGIDHGIFWGYTARLGRNGVCKRMVCAISCRHRSATPARARLHHRQ